MMMPEQGLIKNIELMERNILEICKLYLELKLCTPSGRTMGSVKEEIEATAEAY